MIKWIWLRGPGFDPSQPKITNVVAHPSAMQLTKMDDDERSTLESLLAAAHARPMTDDVDPTSSVAESRLTRIGDRTTALPPDTSRSVEWREPTGTPLIEYDVNYRGGLPEYPKSHGGGIKLRVWPRGLQLNPTIGTRSWFTGLGIPIEVVTAFEIAQRQVSTVEGLLGGLNSRQLNQANNIHITFWRDRIELVLRLEMLSGTFVMAQAGKCRDLMDRLRGNGMLGEIERNRSTLTAASAPAQVTIVAPHAALPEGIPDQIRKLAALRDEGILTSEEFEAKKAELLSRL